jgi:tetratricopeptide (TPR) repeat protein
MRALLVALDGERFRRRRALAAAGAGLVVLLGATAAAASWLAARSSSAAPAQACEGGTRQFEAVWSSGRAARVSSAFSATGSPIAKDATVATTKAMDAFAESWAVAHASICRATHVSREQSDALLDARMECLRRGLRAADALASTFEQADRETIVHATEAVADLPRPDACASVTALADPRPTDPATLEKLVSIEKSIDVVRAGASSGRYAATLPAARDAVAASVALGHPTTIAEARLALATSLRRSGAHADAGREAREAILAAEKARNDSVVARGWLELVAAQGDGGAWSEAEATARHAAAAVERLGVPQDLQAAVLHGSGVVATNLRRFDDAKRDLDLALAIRRRSLAEIEVARTLTAIGNLQRARGDLQLALATHRQALAMDEVSFGRAHPAVARHHHNIAGVLRLMGRGGEAMKSYETSLDVSVAALGGDHTSVALTRNSMGLVLLDGGDVAGARAHFEAALAILERAGHPERAAVLQNLGTALARLGRHAEALERLRAAHTIVVSTLGAGHARAGEIAALIRASEVAPSGPKRASPSGPPPSAKPAGAYVPSQTLDPQ